MLDLTDPAYDVVVEFRDKAMPGDSMQAAVRELVLLALASDVTVASYMAGRRAAYNAASFEVRTKLATALVEAKEQIVAGMQADMLYAGSGR